MMLLDELIRLHKTETWRDACKMSADDVLAYYREMLESERIIPYIVGDELIGYVEYTRLNYAQLGYIVCQQRVFPELFDPQGEIVFIIDLWVKDSKTFGNLINYFKEEILRKSPHVIYMVGQHQGKRLKPYSIHKLKEN